MIDYRPPRETQLEFFLTLGITMMTTLAVMIILRNLLGVGELFTGLIGGMCFARLMDYQRSRR